MNYLKQVVVRLQRAASLLPSSPFASARLFLFPGAGAAAAASSPGALPWTRTASCAGTSGGAAPFSGGGGPLASWGAALRAVAGRGTGGVAEVACSAGVLLGTQLAGQGTAFGAAGALPRAAWSRGPASGATATTAITATGTGAHWSVATAAWLGGAAAAGAAGARMQADGMQIARSALAGLLPLVSIGSNYTFMATEGLSLGCLEFCTIRLRIARPLGGAARYHRCPWCRLALTRHTVEAAQRHAHMRRFQVLIPTPQVAIAYTCWMLPSRCQSAGC